MNGGRDKHDRSRIKMKGLRTVTGGGLFKRQNAWNETYISIERRRERFRMRARADFLRAFTQGFSK